MRLLYVIAYTAEQSLMKEFYRDAVGLKLGRETPGWTDFDSGSGGLALLAINPGQDREIELCFEVADLAAEVRALRQRGVAFMDEVRQHPFGALIHLRDPEGNLLSLLQPAASWIASAGAVAKGHAAAVGTDGGAVGTVTAAPQLSTAIVNVRDLAAAKSFYRDRLGLHVEVDAPWWVAFDSGSTGLALHPRVEVPAADRHHAQAITLGFAVDDLMDWVDGARSRGVPFTTAPIDEGFGLFADAADPDGNELTFREPQAPAPIEEELAEAFEDDGTPQHTAIRKPVKKGARAVSRVAIKPDYKEKTAAKPRRAGAARKAVRAASTRGAGPAGARLKPKRTADPKRARNRPAVGRLKKAERRTLARKKRAVAGASKSKPVKREAARGARGGRGARKARRGSPARGSRGGRR